MFSPDFWPGEGRFRARGVRGNPIFFYCSFGRYKNSVLPTFILGLSVKTVSSCRFFSRANTIFLLDVDLDLKHLVLARCLVHGTFQTLSGSVNVYRFNVFNRCVPMARVLRVKVVLMY
jgi:hypothetical protein